MLSLTEILVTFLRLKIKWNTCFQVNNIWYVGNKHLALFTNYTLVTLLCTGHWARCWENKSGPQIFTDSALSQLGNMTQVPHSQTDFNYMEPSSNYDPLILQIKMNLMAQQVTLAWKEHPQCRTLWGFSKPTTAKCWCSCNCLPRLCLCLCIPGKQSWIGTYVHAEWKGVLGSL